MRKAFLLLAAALIVPAANAQHPRDAEITDPDTRAWWHTTEALSSDSMEGRDVGSEAYKRAAEYVANRFKTLGLTPAGEDGTFIQQVPLHEIQLTPAGTSLTLTRPGQPDVSLAFLQQFTLAANPGLPATLEAPLAFRGYCSKAEAGDLTGKLAVCFGARRKGLPTARDRAQAVRAAGALGIITVDDPSFTLEPPRWPEAYARSVSFSSHPPTPSPFLAIRLSAAAFTTLLQGTSQSATQVLALGSLSKPLPGFDLAAHARITTAFTERDYTSPNILAVIPGSNPTLAPEYLALSAHLDGYGHGTPVQNDEIYNGTLDDAAYVALLIQFAEAQHAQHLQTKRSILLCAFTGEEKGLLGSTWFTQHPTVPKASLIADINLDQLRPLFPLTILTALAVDDTTLGATARAVAVPMHIEIRPDREPERSLLTRADHYPFLNLGIPAIGFIFGYDPGTDAERRYRQWYTIQYHRPQDDLTQPIDFAAATKFNTFFYTLARTIANAPTRPAMTAQSPYKK